MYNMKLEKNELSLVILGMEALIEQLKDAINCDYAEGYNDAIAKIKEEAKYIQK